MPPSVYTERFLFLDAGALEASYEVPAGKRAIIRSMLYASYGASASWLQLQVHGHRVYSRDIPGGLFGGSLEMQAVAYERETVKVLTAGPDVRVMLSGYLFEDPIGAPPATKPGPDEGPGRPTPATSSCSS